MTRYRNVVAWAVEAVIGIPYQVQLIQPGDPFPALEAPDLEGLINHWSQVQNTCKKKSPKIAALLRSTQPVALIGSVAREVVVQVGYEFPTSANIGEA